MKLPALPVVPCAAASASAAPLEVRGVDVFPESVYRVVARGRAART
jgi:hypothetical protein